MRIMDRMSIPDVLIVGGGVIGLTTAYYLARDGVRVTLVEAGEIGRQASWAGAGILVPGDPARARTPIDQLRARSVALYPELSAALRDETGIDNGYRVCGGVELPEEGHDGRPAHGGVARRRGVGRAAARLGNQRKDRRPRRCMPPAPSICRRWDRCATRGT